MADKARFAFGSKANIGAAIESGAVDEFDFLCLSGENEKPSVGWIDKNGNPVFVECEKYVEVVDALPETGVENVLYMCEGNGYTWYNNAFVPVAKQADLTEITTQVSNLETQIGQKVDIQTVQGMIEEYSAHGFEIVEF